MKITEGEAKYMYDWAQRWLEEYGDTEGDDADDE